ncbi:MAG: hypothetical protein ACRCZI_07555, partial [Cetobacterium sp.]
VIIYPDDLRILQGPTLEVDRSQVGVERIGRANTKVLTRTERWIELRDTDHQAKLITAFKNYFSN